jgi:hypothetical protein
MSIFCINDIKSKFLIYKIKNILIIKNIFFKRKYLKKMKLLYYIIFFSLIRMLVNVLYINPCSIEKNEKISINKYNTAWLEFDYLEENILKSTDFDELFLLHPKSKNKIVTTKIVNDEKIFKDHGAHRYYESYGEIPKLDLSILQNNYMFSDLNSKKKNMPKQFENINNYINKYNEYNQITVTWYDTNSDYIPYHSDWKTDMEINSNISILTLNKNDNDENCRKFIIKPKKYEKKDSLYDKIEIIAKHGYIIKMCGDFQEKYFHGIPKGTENSTQRISVSFRNYNLNN